LRDTPYGNIPFLSLNALPNFGFNVSKYSKTYFASKYKIKNVSGHSKKSELKKIISRNIFLMKKKEI